MALKNIGPVGLNPKGDWDAKEPYKKLSLVNHNNTSWVARVDNTGVEPSEENSDTWYLMAKGGSGGGLGGVYVGTEPPEDPNINFWLNPEGTTFVATGEYQVTGQGIFTQEGAFNMYQELTGGLSGKLGSSGNGSNLTETFTTAGTRANIATGEKHSVIFGKIAKFFGDLKSVAFSGSYNDLSNKPTIPTVNNGTLTIQKNGSNVATFSANQSGNATANISVPSVVNNLTTTSSGSALDASQGKALKSMIDGKLDNTFSAQQHFFAPSVGFPPYGGDLNDAPIGFTWHSNYDSGSSNRPDNTYGGYLLTIKENGWGMQILFPRDGQGSRIYSRHLINGNWTSWGTIS